jgi:beta-D-xylosidase 4
VAYAEGADINSDNTTGFGAALAIAKAADAIIYIGGIDTSVEAESMVCILILDSRIVHYISTLR